MDEKRETGAIEMNLKLFLILAVICLAVIFVIQNVRVVELTFFFWTLSMSRALLIFLILSIGIILGWLLRGSIRRIKSMPIQNKAL